MSTAEKAALKRAKALRDEPQFIEADRNLARCYFALLSENARMRDALKTLADAKWTDDLTRDIALKATTPQEQP